MRGWRRGAPTAVAPRDRLGAVRAPAIVLAGEDDAWAPLESAQEVAELLGGQTRFRGFAGARHSVFRDEPRAYDELAIFLDDIQAEAAA